MSPRLAARPASSSHQPAHVPTLLVVDDDRVTRIMLQEMLEQQGYNVFAMERGAEALDFLVRHAARTDAVVLDREMPDMPGLVMVEKMKADPQLSGIPVIMLTGTGDSARIQEGIDAGVFYYLVKPVEMSLINTVIASALRERSQKLALIAELSQFGAALKAMQSCHISVKTLREAEDAACLLASCFPDPERVVSGLMELAVNAVEHGNLGISYEAKHALLEENRWREEIERRAALPENQGKTAEITYQHKDGNHLVRIADAGAGFDWKRYWHVNPARASASHGRGIARARLMAFDRMAYNEAGNQVTVAVSDTPARLGDYAW
jgi:response regulator RpfG family c-di-GMP phosphodiesterase